MDMGADVPLRGGLGGNQSPRLLAAEFYSQSSEGLLPPACRALRGSGLPTLEKWTKNAEKNL